MKMRNSTSFWNTKIHRNSTWGEKITLGCFYIPEIYQIFETFPISAGHFIKSKYSYSDEYG